MTRAAHARGEDFCRRDECRGIGAKVEEELSEHVEDEEMAFGEALPAESEDTEDYGEDAKAGDLNAFAAEGVDGEDGKPVAGEGAGADEYDLAGCRVAEVEVEVVALVEAHGGHEGGRRKA